MRSMNSFLIEKEWKFNSTVNDHGMETNEDSFYLTVEPLFLL